MEQWDQDFVDAEVEGYLKFGPRNLGSFQFGYVQGEIDNRLTTRDGKPCLEFTWEGNDEMAIALAGAGGDARVVRPRSDAEQLQPNRIFQPGVL